MKKLTVPYYELGTKLTEEQLELFDEHGAIIFRNFITPEKGRGGYQCASPFERKRFLRCVRNYLKQVFCNEVFSIERVAQRIN